MPKKFWNFRNEASSDGNTNAELLLYGPISEQTWWGDEITPKQFNTDLAQCAGQDLTVRINSGGGDVFAAQAIHNALAKYEGNVTVMIDGLCASAATIIACAGNKVVMPDNAFYMIHNPVVGMFDYYDAEELEKTSEYLGKVKKTITNVYQKRANSLSEDELVKLMDDETWMTADEAKEYGFIDEIEGELEGSPTINKGMVFVNDISCKFSAKNADKLEKLIRKGSVTNMDNKSFLDQLASALGLNKTEDAVSPDTTNSVSVEEKERQRMLALDAMKSGNAAVDAIIETAKSNGSTVDSIQPFIDAVAGVEVPVPKNDAIEAVRKLVEDQLNSGAANVESTPAVDGATKDAVNKQKEIDDVVNFANQKGAK